jgi:DNA-directed RNA polymerase subunit M/transcription elongation factor TFIIS
MQFCPICGTRLITKTRGKTVSHCPKCKKKFDCSEEKILKEKTKDSSQTRSDFPKGIVVIDKKVQKLRTLPTVDSECIKCKGKKAETWTLDLGSEDNSQAIFFRCISCGHTSRQTE